MKNLDLQVLTFHPDQAVPCPSCIKFKVQQRCIRQRRRIVNEIDPCYREIIYRRIMNESICVCYTDEISIQEKERKELCRHNVEESRLTAINEKVNTF